MTKKLFLLLSVLLITAIFITACTTTDTAAPADTGSQAAAADTGLDTTTSGGEVYYLNFKPEVSEIYDEIAKAYKEETGVTLKVVTAASGTYEQTLKSEIAKSDAPVLFQINGPRGYAN